MSSKEALCEELSVKDYLNILDDNDILKDKLEELGVVIDADGISVPLNYSDLLTEDEKLFLTKLSDEFNAKYKGDTTWFVKFSNELQFKYDVK